MQQKEVHVPYPCSEVWPANLQGLVGDLGVRDARGVAHLVVDHAGQVLIILILLLNLNSINMDRNTCEDYA